MGPPIKHGLARHKLYYVWNDMKTRCYNSKAKHFKIYGGRGIKICDDWIVDFMNFYNWALQINWQEGLTIDRINNDGNYEPDNCRFINRKLNNRNRGNNRLITYKGETKCITEWGEIVGISAGCIFDRLHRGWSVERSFEEPLNDKHAPIKKEVQAAKTELLS